MDPHDFRKRFRGLDDLVHLASCSQGAVSDLLVDALAEYQRTLVDKGADWESWMDRVQQARELFAAQIGADVDEIAVVPSASEGAYQVASTQAWASRPGLVTTDMEFPSVANVWLAQEPRGAKVTHVADHDWTIDAEDYVEQIGPDTGLVSIPLISYRNGLRLPVTDVVRAAHEVGARVFVDAYQGLGVEPVDVHTLDCDYLVSGSLKYLLGIPGIAFLYVREGLVDDLPPSLTGWFGRVDPFAFDPRSLDYPTHARRFETGTPAVPSAYAAVAGLQMLAQVDMSDVAAHVGHLSGLLREELVAQGETVRSPESPTLRGPQIALQDSHPERLDGALREAGIAASPRGDVVRLSFHYYNDESDVIAATGAVRAYRAKNG
ncbi:MAG: aminotransferase class V-fold PLP-dependent enzyme [Nocardioides sp.]